jgi:hypothetical protein
MQQICIPTIHTGPLPANFKELNMNARKTLIAIAAIAASLPAAYAGNFVGGEAGYDTHPVNSSRSRAQVQQEYQAFRDHPVYSDGTVMLQGEAGYVSANQGVSADRQPSGPHTHVLGNTGAPAATAAPMGDAERRAYRQQYIN